MGLEKNNWNEVLRPECYRMSVVGPPRLDWSSVILLSVQLTAGHFWYGSVLVFRVEIRTEYKAGTKSVKRDLIFYGRAGKTGPLK